MAGIFERKGEEEKYFRQVADANPHTRRIARVSPDGSEDVESIEDGESVQRALQASKKQAMLRYHMTLQKYSISDEEKKARAAKEVRESIKHFEHLVAVPYLLLLPESKSMQQWDMCTMVALLFTALVTPYEVALLPTRLNGLFIVNRMIDAIFVCDMVINFFLAFRDESPSGGRRLVKDFKTIRRRYLGGWFTIDLISVLPFDLLGFLSGSALLTRFKLVRVLRLMRLLKLARVVRASRVFKRMEANISISYSVIGLIQFSVMLLVMGHWCVCCSGSRKQDDPRLTLRPRALAGWRVCGS